MVTTQHEWRRLGHDFTIERKAEYMPVDPMAALAINMAVGPGTFAVFLGSGISAPAGIPTGGEVLRETCRRLQIASVPQAAGGSQGDPVEWARGVLGSEATYNSILEAVFPTSAARREFLSSFFEGKAPTEAHRCLARLTAKGFVRVFVTTNFDRLMEQALDEAGVRHVSVASDDELVGMIKPQARELIGRAV